MNQGPARRDREIGELLGIALAMFQENIGIILGATAIVMFLPALVMIPAGIMAAIMGAGAGANGNIDPEKIVPLVGIIGVAVIIAFIAYTAVKIGFTSICLQITRGSKPAFSEFTSNFGYFANFLGVSLLIGIVVLAGCLLLVVPGIFFGIKLIFGPLLVIDKNMGPIEAMKESWSMTEGVSLKIFFAGLAYFVINLIVGLIPLIGMVGQFLVYPFFELLVCSIYRNKKGDLAA